jgi:hypothetical protein
MLNGNVSGTKMFLDPAGFYCEQVSLFSEMVCHVDWLKFTDISEQFAAPIFALSKIKSNK